MIKMVFGLSLILVGLAIFLLCINILFKKDGEFPETEVGHNREMRKRGIICAKEDEIRMLRKLYRKPNNPNCSDDGCSSCTSGCDPHISK